MARRKLNEQGEIRFFEWMEDRIKDEGSRKAFAEKVGVHPNNLSTLRNGSKAPTVRMAEKLAAAYGLTISDVVGYGGVAEDDYKPRGDRTGKRKKKEPETDTQKQPWELVMLSQMETIDNDIMKLEEEIRQLKLKKEHFAEIFAVYNDWRADNAD